MMERPYRIMVVDDEDFVRTMLMEMLRKKSYETAGAANGADALAGIAPFDPDMVISDIIMPGMDGFALMQKIETKYPKIKRILMTGYDIDSYIDMIRRYNVGNILPKGTDFNLDDMGEYIGSLLTGNIFGLEKYFTAGAVETRLITNEKQAHAACSAVAQLCLQADRFYFEIALSELVSNAVFHGVLQVTGLPREKWPEEFSLKVDEAIRISWAQDNERIGVSVEDPKGNLRKVDVLHWLDHRIDEKVSENEHGRGFMLIRRFIDRFIVNIDRSRRTECIILQNRDTTWKNRHKPLLIHEL